MKKTIFIAFVTIVSIFILYFGISLLVGYSGLGTERAEKFKKPIKSGKEGEILPVFDIILPDSVTYLNIDNTPRGKPVVIFYFGPDCPFCQSEIRQIINGIDLLKDIQFYIVTPYSFPQMKTFYDRFELSRYPNFSVGIDYKYFLSSYFKTNEIPFIAIYGRNRVLNAAFVGNISIDQIRSVALK